MKKIKSLLQTFGFDVKRIRRAPSRVPSLYEDPMEALYRMRDQERALVSCPIHLLVRPNGWKFGPGLWNPFSAAAREVLNDPEAPYSGSTLDKYYAAFQPRNGREAIIGVDCPIEPLESLAPIFQYWAPWINATPDELRKELEIAYHQDLAEHKGPAFLEIDKHGWKDHGPVHEAFGEFEYDRIRRATISIKRNGFDIKFGAPRAYILRRGGEFFFLIRGGVHRVASLDALGYTHIPVQPAVPWCIDLAEVEYWSSVRSKIWSASDAEIYFHHLFDFDSGSALREIVFGSDTSTPAASRAFARNNRDERAIFV